ncbi:hypothetical protein BH09BAC6_BH09BAC6_04010 [soil metagenome]
MEITHKNTANVIMYQFIIWMIIILGTVSIAAIVVMLAKYTH